MDFLSGELKTRMQYVGLYISDKEPFRDHVLEVFDKFQNTFKKFG